MDIISYVKSKIFFDINCTQQTIERWRFQNKKLVFTNGVFDIMHLGHLYYLAKATSIGSKLIVGLNSDVSVKKIKGDDRPIENQKSRAMHLASMLFIDMVVLFDDSTPISLIKFIRPDVLVKGSDYTKDTIVGASFIESYGGKITILPLLEGFSSSSIIDTLKSIE